MKRKLLSLVLAVLMLVSIIPVSAVANEIDALPASFSSEIVNPVYQDLIPSVMGSGESELPYSPPGGAGGGQALPKATKYYTTVDSLAPAVREHMKNRRTQFTVGYRFLRSQWNDAGYNAMISDLMDDNSVMAHTGDPREGDYLKFHYFGGYTDTDMDNYDRNYVYATITFYNMRYSTTASQEATVDSYVNSLLSQLGTSGTNYQKIWRVYDWMCRNIRYDYNNLHNSSYLLKYSAYAAVAQKTAVCQGYAMLMYRFALEMGVDCRAVYSIDSENHIWNIVSMGSLYYNLDATWDEGQPRYTWFLQSNATFTRDGRHTRSPDFNVSSFNSRYPMGQYDYDPNTAANIVTQPRSVSVANGKNAKVTVQASGSGLSYAWYYKDAGSSKFYRTTAFTGNSYEVPMNPERNGRQVYCKVTDWFGNTVTTNTVKLSMTKTALKITQQPASVAVAKGATAKVAVKATGDGLTYKWYYKDKGASDYTYTSAFKGNTYQVEMTAARSGRRVLCRVYDMYGNVIQSDSALLSMKTVVKITGQPQDVTVAKGATAKVTVKATGDGLTYKWYYKDKGASDYTYTSSFKGNTYQTEMTAARNGRRVLCRVYDKYGNVVQSDSALLSMKQTVKNTVKIVGQIENATVAEGATAKVTVKATGDGLTYKWYYKDKGDSDYTYTSSFKGDTYQVQMTAARSGRRVMCRVYDKYGNVAQSDSALMSMKQTVRNTVKIVGQIENATVAKGATAKVTVKATGDGLTYKWYYKDKGASDYTYTSSFKGDTYQVQMTAARSGRQVLCRVCDKYGNVAQSDPVTLKMK